MNIIRLQSADNVAVALCDLTPGETGGIILKENIKRGHKVALVAINEGEPVIKYGYPIGLAACDIKPGEWVHTHNLKTGLGGTLSYTYNPVPAMEREKKSGTFMGYPRADGRAGVRNEIFIVPTVGCLNGPAGEVAKRTANLVGGGLEGIYAFGHPYGCSQLGEDHENTRRALKGLILHPNAAGVLVMALGCENNQLDALKAFLGDYDKSRVRFLTAQDVADEVEEGIRLVKELAEIAIHDKRVPVSLGKLVVGLKCGGSDGLSGITANPLIGRFADRLTAHGGTAILTEVPEMFGAETILMNRCVDRDLFGKTVSLINDFKEYYISAGQNIYENPSPGNKAGGITTLEDKALGCTQKGGTSPVTDVLDYGKPACVPGLNLLSAPGNDLVAATALMVSGAQIVLFSTGRGTPFGCPVPTVKVSTNTALFELKRGWIDYDAGVLASGALMDSVDEDFFSYVLSVASGKRVRTEEMGYREFTVFKNGVTL